MLQTVEKTHSRFCSLDLPYRDKGVGKVGAQGRQIRIRAEHRVAEHSRADLVGQTDQSGHGKASIVLDHVNARPGVAAGARKKNRRLAQLVPFTTTWALLGRLINRRSSDSATGSAIFGLPL